MLKQSPSKAILTSRLRQSLGVALGMSFAAAASWAQTVTPAPPTAGTEEPRDPYYIGVGLGFTHESNVLRQAVAESDNLVSTTLLGGLNTKLGRQRFYLDGTISDNRYQNISALNNTSYGLTTGLDLSTSGRLSGSLRYGVTESLANQATPGLVSTGQSNTEKSQLAGARLRLEVTSRVAMEAGLQHRSLDYSEPTFVSRENIQNVANAGLVYGVTGYLTFGVGVRATKIDTPYYSPAGGDKTDRKDVDFTSTWSPSSLSTLTGRLSVGKEDHSRATASNFSGLTGLVSWDYRPTGRLNFTTSFSRDTGTETRFIGFVGGTEPLATEAYRLTNTAQANVHYLVTGKIDTNVSVSRTTGPLVSGNVASGSDTLDTYGIGVTYRATRSMNLICQLGHESRSTTSIFSTAYSANTVGCMARLTLR
jgi:hypothetical protein